MIYLFGPKRILWVITLTVVGLISAWTLLNPAPAAIDVWKSRGLILIALSGAVALLSLEPVLWAVHKVSFGKLWWFPWLGGQWTGEVRSNWPLVKGMLSAKEGEAPTEGVVTDGILPVAIETSIKVGLFSIEIVLRPVETERISRTIFVRPSWCKPSLPTIHYVYEQRDAGVIARTDQRTHLGAACLTYDPGSGRLEGDYWTQRSADLGLNTAGTITLVRRAKA